MKNYKFWLLMLLAALILSYLVVHQRRKEEARIRYNLEFHSEIKDTSVLK